MSNPLRPYIIERLLSTRTLNRTRRRAEKKRRRHKQPHLVTVYVALDDPHSYLLLQLLPTLQMRFDIEYDFRTVLHKQPEMYPTPQLWQENAFRDGRWLANLYQLSFPAAPPTSTAERDEQLTAQLLHWELQPGYLDNALALFHAYWQQDTAALETLVSPTIRNNPECYQHHLEANEKMLQEQGHYLSAMLHYGGEWYWGLNRLQYLERRLLELPQQNTPDTTIHYNLGHRQFCQKLSTAEVADLKEKRGTSQLGETPLELFLSIRSPYSYIGIVRGRQLADHYQIPLVIKPVLPMVMRRMQVPSTKSTYIARDVKREAEQYRIPFGRIADPLGAGVERCYALIELAQSQGKMAEFIESYARGVWAEGIRSDTDSGLKTLVERVGLSWAEAQPRLKDDRWRLWAQSNLLELYSHGLWGVPSFVYGDVKLFGQDRLDQLEDAIVRKM